MKTDQSIKKDLIQAIRNHHKIKKKTCIKILHDLAKTSQCTFNFIKNRYQYLLFPNCYCLVDGITNQLRYFAKTHQSKFSSTFGKIIGEALVEDIKKDFEQYDNFKVHTDVLLRDYDRRLPDIDILAISYDPSYGVHIFVCEVKNNLPAIWAKEYVKAQYEKGFLNKAFSQIAKLKSFLKTKEGTKLITSFIFRSFSHQDFKLLFPTGIYVRTNYLIVTSQSIGMFFPNKDVSVINSNFFHHILEACDGDTNYIISMINDMEKNLDSCYERSSKTLNLGDYQIIVDMAEVKHFFELPKHQYLSAGKLTKIEKAVIDSEYEFIDYEKQLKN